MPDNPLDPTFTPGRDDEALVDALTIIRVVMDAVVNASPPMLSEATREHCLATWPEVRGRIDFLVEMIRTPPTAVAAPGRRALTGAEAGALREVGLTGSPLALKVGGIKRALGRWLAGAGGFVRRHAHSFFKWSNTFLGSLAEALGPAADFIKEFKECLENDLEDQELEDANGPTAPR